MPKPIIKNKTSILVATKKSTKTKFKKRKTIPEHNSKSPKKRMNLRSTKFSLFDFDDFFSDAISPRSESVRKSSVVFNVGLFFYQLFFYFTVCIYNRINN